MDILIDDSRAEAIQNEITTATLGYVKACVERLLKDRKTMLIEIERLYGDLDDAAAVIAGVKRLLREWEINEDNDEEVADYNRIINFKPSLR